VGGQSKSNQSPVMEAHAYRAIMRHQAGAVTIIAVGKPGHRTGLTATAVCSVTDAPPTILVCINRKASAHAPIMAEKSFTVNMLARPQTDLALRFSGRAGVEGEDRFDADAWTTLVTGAPILKGAIASLDCEVTEFRDMSTHSVFIGRVVAGTADETIDPLLYFRGEFWDLVRR